MVPNRGVYFNYNLRFMGNSGEKSPKPNQRYRKFFFPTFKFVIISICTWKSNPLGLGNCCVPNFCKTGFRYFCSLFTGIEDKFVPYAARLLIPKNQNYSLGNADLGFFVSYGLRTTMKITIFSTSYVIDNFSGCYSRNSCKRKQTLSVKLFSK